MGQARITECLASEKGVEGHGGCYVVEIKQNEKWSTVGVSRSDGSFAVCYINADIASTQIPNGYKLVSV